MAANEFGDDSRGGSAMIVEDPDCPAPADVNIPLWRYMDFAKFVSLVMRRKLWFSRPDRFEDKWEGSYGRLNQTEPLRRVIPSVGTLDDLTPEQFALIAEFDAASREASWDELRLFYGVSCWHHNEVESAAMWKIYGRAGAEIAVLSTYAQLRDSLQIGEGQHLVMCKVSYEKDYEDLYIKTPRPWSTLTHKRLSFCYEQEYRVIVWEWQTQVAETQKAMQAMVGKPTDATKPGRIDLSGYDAGGGVEIPVDLDLLIERVFVSPTSNDPFRTLVSDFCQEHGIPPDRVETSSLGDSRRPIR
jgi:hypothetical protein